jgi:hypothetical protein
MSMRYCRPASTPIVITLYAAGKDTRAPTVLFFAGMFPNVNVLTSSDSASTSSAIVLVIGVRMSPLATVLTSADISDDSEPVFLKAILRY